MIVLRRPAQQTDLSAYAVLVALAGTAGGLLVRPGGDPLVAGWIAGLMMLTGILFNISAKVSLNRSFGMTAANRGVKRQGPYRFMRHPMYVGYAITQLGFLLMNPTLWNLAVYAMAWTAQLLRIGAEERVLSHDPEYRAYAGAVRYRLVPGLY
jgi:protein-S-isoprenylcysteine O-methyltransferase Ste14